LGFCRSGISIPHNLRFDPQEALCPILQSHWVSFALGVLTTVACLSGSHTSTWPQEAPTPSLLLSAGQLAITCRRPRHQIRLSARSGAFPPCFLTGVESPAGAISDVSGTVAACWIGVSVCIRHQDTSQTVLRNSLTHNDLQEHGGYAIRKKRSVECVRVR
jgi:hypothetical protein